MYSIFLIVRVMLKITFNYSAPPQQNSRGSQLAGLIKEQSESKQRDRPK